MMLSSTSGHACLSFQAATGGVHVSCRPWTITPGIPCSVFGAFEQLAFLEPAVVRHVMILDPRDRDRDVGRGEMLDRHRGSGSSVTISPSHLLHALAAASCSALSSLVSRLR